MDMETHVIIMAGGVGSRLWPVSTPQMPKQFIDLLGIGKTMLQITVERLLPVCNKENFWVVTSEKYVDVVRRQLPDLPAGQVLAEPVARNTAPCIAYACRKIAAQNPDSNVIVTPADALVINVQRFALMLRRALNFTEQREAIVTVGITPSRPETGYGYIRMSENQPEQVVKVDAFKEKPDRATAEAYLANGNYVWNAGIFVWNVRTILSQLRRYAPALSETMDRIAASFGTEGEHETLAALFPQCESVSIDYAVMEKSDCIHVIAGDIGWSDLGSYSSVKDHIPASADDPCPDPGSADAERTGNKIIGGDIRLVGCENCIVHADGSEKVVVSGLKDYIVAVRDGKVLVCPLAEEQRIKDYVQKN